MTNYCGIPNVKNSFVPLIPGTIRNLSTRTLNAYRDELVDEYHKEARNDD